MTYAKQILLPLIYANLREFKKISGQVQGLCVSPGKYKLHHKDPKGIKGAPLYLS